MKRSEIIYADYLSLIDHHLDEVIGGKTDRMFELRDIAGEMCIHPTHLSNVIRELTGHHPCYFYEHKILERAKTLLSDPGRSISDVAFLLTYDNSNFTKWFKKYSGSTPKAFRMQVFQNTETVTI